jgi:hypothetical protein
MVGAAATWLLSADPSLTPDQVATVLKRSARDVEEEGVDDLTGAGMLDVARALAQTPPRADAREPNEDIRWVDGSLLDRAQPALRSGGGPLFARLDRYEDPVDVYALRLRAGAGARMQLRSSDGDAALAVYDPRARSVSESRHRIARSDRAGSRSETVRFRNRARRARTFFVRVTLARRDPDATALAYRLRAARRR